jgi:adenosine deaminase/aminodeoxyfutalosine deaminase
VAVTPVPADQSYPPGRIISGVAALPKAELHLHLEGTISPSTAVELAARHGMTITVHEVSRRYAPGDFFQFLEAFKWVTSFLRTPADYALVTERMAEQLLTQNVVYAEVTLSIGVMLLRKQDPLANFEEVRRAAAAFEPRGLKLRWIFDAVRQFGVDAAAEVANLASQCVGEGVVAFGLGGDELSLLAADFRSVYEHAAKSGLERMVHAGEIGNASSVREAVEQLGVSRIGHGIAVMNDAYVMDFLSEREVTLELCPTSNIRTGALARQLGQPHAQIRQHPLPEFLRRGLNVTLSTDDPAMFETTLLEEYGHAVQMGLHQEEILRLAEMSFQSSFLPAEEKQTHIHALRSAYAKNFLK